MKSEPLPYVLEMTALEAAHLLAVLRWLASNPQNNHPTLDAMMHALEEVVPVTLFVERLT